MAVDQPVLREQWGGTMTHGVVGGIVAGGVFLALNMWFATSVGDPAKGPLLMMSTIVRGDEAIMAGSVSVGVGLAVHLVLSAAYGVAFAALASHVWSAGAIAGAGVVYGAALYLLNFKLFSPALFTTFEMANQPFEFVAHVVFGSLLALAFLAPGVSLGRNEGAASRGRARAMA